MQKYSKYKKEDLIKLIENSTSISEVMLSIGLVPRGSNYSRFKKNDRIFSNRHIPF